MTPEELIKEHEKLCASARELFERKSHDYAGDVDAFANLRLCEELGICPAEAGVLVRMSDKLSRMATLLTKDPRVTSESITDTGLDMINYTVMLLSLLKEKHPNVSLAGWDFSADPEPMRFESNRRDVEDSPSQEGFESNLDEIL